MLPILIFLALCLFGATLVHSAQEWGEDDDGWGDDDDGWGDDGSQEISDGEGWGDDSQTQWVDDTTIVAAKPQPQTRQAKAKTNSVELTSDELLLVPDDFIDELLKLSEIKKRDEILARLVREKETREEEAQALAAVHAAQQAEALRLPDLEPVRNLIYSFAGYLTFRLELSGCEPGVNQLFRGWCHPGKNSTEPDLFVQSPMVPDSSKSYQCPWIHSVFRRDGAKFESSHIQLLKGHRDGAYYVSRSIGRKDGAIWSVWHRIPNRLHPKFPDTWVELYRSEWVSSKDVIPTQWRRKEHLMECEECDGKGGLPDGPKRWVNGGYVRDTVKCEPCNNTGFLTVQDHGTDATMCNTCQGRLIVNEEACPACKDGRLVMTLTKLSDLDLANS